jgi:Glycosyltransferase sugar-binding region containing DXD motif
VPANAYSARSNLLRYALLYERGGVYVDFDVLVRKPLADLGGGRAFVGSEQVWAFDQARVEGKWRASMLPATVGWALAWALRRADCKMNGGRAHLARRLQVLNPLGGSRSMQREIARRRAEEFSWTAASASYVALFEQLTGGDRLSPSIQRASTYG